MGTRIKKSKHRLAGEKAKFVHHKLFQKAIKSGLSVRDLCFFSGLYPEVIQGRVALTVGKCVTGRLTLIESAERIEGMVANKKFDRRILVKRMGISYRSLGRRLKINHTEACKWAFSEIPSEACELIDKWCLEVAGEFRKVADLLEAAKETAFADRNAAFAAGRIKRWGK